MTDSKDKKPDVAEDEWVGTELLFENEKIRVWDFQLAPGESSKQHTHRRDWMYVYTTGDNRLRIRYPEMGEVERVFPEGYTMFNELSGVPVERLTHRVTNIGPTLHRQIVIEFKGPIGATK